MLIAETVQFEIPAWFVALALAVLLLFLLGIVAVVVIGFRSAGRAGRGSRSALTLFIAIAGVETFSGFWAVVQRGYRFGLLWLVPVGLAAAQTFTYFEAKVASRRDQ
ncbi:MAG: hypothetical protein Q8K63_03815 [Acidimicrobiales bacterium]|nr:hypothetical protein [Acidimicrobiales bacterium]